MAATENKKIQTPSGNYFYACGKRKTAIAKVRFYPKGENKITVNGVDIKEWSDYTEQVQKIKSPLSLLNVKDYTITIKVIGGGHNAQAEAMRLGIAKALTVFDETNRGSLKKVGFLSRDSRIKERKKPGLKRARRASQFSKR